MKTLQLINKNVYKGWNMVLDKYQRAFGVFSNYGDTEAALAELKTVEFPMKQVSVIAPNTRNVNTTTKVKAQEAANIGAIAGDTIGLTLGLEPSSFVPIIGSLALLGVTAATLATTLISSGGGTTVGALVAALIDYGIPKQQAKIYSDRIHKGNYFLIIEGTEAAIRQAEVILTRWHIQELRIYDATPEATPII